ncbi:uncharacterized protein CLUP02_12440 [Colletotrichum lupini]|uniref:Uncharacterized protein n=1 Tax=Colletotrichum lupini TaxID=145971 RepID=A0A9Q8T0H1_9PEZI|nr:uncharacterized protein CLUP02_12440 [Colletotrichum lupini]UQC86938.1 hypothetical protein CLUP02_12440 [Colletotrichum lupini]
MVYATWPCSVFVPFLPIHVCGLISMPPFIHVLDIYRHWSSPRYTNEQWRKPRLWSWSIAPTLILPIVYFNKTLLPPPRETNAQSSAWCLRKCNAANYTPQRHKHPDPVACVCNTHRRSTDFSYLRLFGSDDAIGIVVPVRLDLPRLSRRLLHCNSALHNLNHFFNCPLVVTPSGFRLSRVKSIHCLSLSVTFSPLFRAPSKPTGCFMPFSVRCTVPMVDSALTRHPTMSCSRPFRRVVSAVSFCFDKCHRSSPRGLARVVDGYTSKSTPAGPIFSPSRGVESKVFSVAPTDMGASSKPRDAKTLHGPGVGTDAGAGGARILN